ncbi:MAG: DoxX family protein, partial [Muribaculaceae bacterium]|nr:DoxX family protein [Muribaculaceae bacterium]
MRLKEAVSELEGWRWNRLGVIIVRLVVGLVFVYSGFSKAVDPWGGYYKFNEYFLALGLDSFVSLSLFFAFALAAIEFLLGVFLITGAYKRSTPIILTLLMAVMLPLTFYLAVSNVVSDCGCFGDAVHLSNWGTFFKNVLLTVAIIYLLLFNRKYEGLYSPAVHWLVLLGSFAFITAVAYNGYFVQPLRDYRPYKVGTRVASNVAEP